MHSFEVSLGYESVDRSTFSMALHVENVVRSTLSYPNETSKECIQFLLLYLNHTKFNIVEFFVVNFICVRLFAVGNYYAIDCLHLTSSWRHVQVRI
jgi:hypothetical protein